MVRKLSSNQYDHSMIQAMYRVLEALGKGSITLGKGSAMCRPQHRSHGNQSDGVLFAGHSVKLLPSAGEALGKKKEVGDGQLMVTESLLSAMTTKYSAKPAPLPKPSLPLC